MMLLSLHCLKIADSSGNLTCALKIDYSSILGKDTINWKKVVFCVDCGMRSYK